MANLFLNPGVIKETDIPFWIKLRIFTPVTKMVKNAIKSRSVQNDVTTPTTMTSLPHNYDVTTTMASLPPLL